MNPYLFPGLLKGGTLIRRSFRRVPREDWDRPLELFRFSPREIMAHLADWESVARCRMKQAIERPGSEVTAWDEGKAAIDGDYHERDPFHELERFQQERAQTAAFLKGLDEDELQQTIHHPEYGIQSIADMVAFQLGHDLYHIDQLDSYID
ncbi:MAG: DinB family protein [Fimbriimonadaceae bacterium]|jgi:hypothetical protein|nr:DinB family protein [Fimbriimonadaceae bacterium]